MGAKKFQLIVWCVCIAASACIFAGDEPRTSKLYYNKNFAFCVDSPADWSYADSFTRNGAIFAPKRLGGVSLPPRISVGAYVDQPSESGNGAQTLDENIQSSIESLRKHGSAIDVLILKTKEIILQNLPARSLTLEYRDAKSGQQWFKEEIDLMNEKKIVYFLELECSPKDAAPLQAVFDSLIHSFRLKCDRKGETRTE